MDLIKTYFQNSFEFTEEEIQEVNRMQQEFYAKIIQTSDKTNEEINVNNEYSKYFKNIYSKARNRSLEYFGVNTTELFKALKQEVKNRAVYVAYIVEKGRKKEERYIELWKNNFNSNNKPYLEILREKAPKNYSKLIKYIDEVFEHREELLRAEKDKELPVLDRNYTSFLQNTGLNEFNKIAQMKETRGEVQIFAGSLTYTQGNTTIEIPHYEELLQKSNIKNLELSTPLHKILDIATGIFTEKHSPVVKFSLDEYMKAVGIKDKKEARKQVNSALDILYDVSISYDDSKNKDRSRSYRDMRLVDDKGIERGIIRIRFGGSFVEELEKCQIMSYPLRILQLSQGREHRNSFYIARKLCELKNMNAGKRNEYVISVKTLLNACPYLPTEEEVRNTNRNYKERIIEPFISDFEEAINALYIGTDNYEWHYARGKEIPFENLINLEYGTFIEAYIRIDEWPDYPRLEVIENKEKQREKAINNLKGKKKKSKGEGK